MLEVCGHMCCEADSEMSPTPGCIAITRASRQERYESIEDDSQSYIKLYNMSSKAGHRHGHPGTGSRQRIAKLWLARM